MGIIVKLFVNIIVNVFVKLIVRVHYRIRYGFSCRGQYGLIYESEKP